MKQFISAFANKTKSDCFEKNVLTFQFLVLIVPSDEDDQAQPGYATSAPDKRGCSSKLEWSHTCTHTHTHAGRERERENEMEEFLP